METLKERFERAQEYMNRLKDQIKAGEVCENNLTALSCCIDVMLDKVTAKKYNL
jgi:hypothetical protein